MVASLFSKGHASTIGLQSTSISPLPIAYRTMLQRIPVKGSGRISGRTASPAAAQASEATTHTRYPILSTNLAQNRSTRSCVKKKQVEIKAIFPREIAPFPFPCRGCHPQLCM